MILLLIFRRFVMYRFMRIIVLFDLPTETSEDRKSYTKFRKYLIKKGFLMMQESVYVKLTLNGSASHSVMEGLRKNKPSKGIVQALIITERQYASMECLVGKVTTDILNTDERTVII